MTFLRLRPAFSVLMAFPDVDKKPLPGGPVPIPYPNIGSDTTTR